MRLELLLNILGKSAERKSAIKGVEDINVKPKMQLIM
jgi:hypothetical protein